VPAIPWTRLTERDIDPDREYLALITYLPLNSYLAIRKFLILTRQVRNQLKESEGAIGYSLLADIFKKEFWTMSVWKDEDYLSRFVRTGAHAHTMTELTRHLSERRKFVKVGIKGFQIPPGWDQAKRIVGL
jgi:heme-degrading monooxygenase HmoA